MHDSSPASSGEVLPFLQGGGETGALIRARDWSSTRLGPPENWPQALRTAVTLMLASRQPAYVAWGADLVSLYNDGYIPFLGTRHPRALGLPYVEVWPEVAGQMRPVIDALLAGEAQFVEDQPLALEGRNRPMSWFTWSWTPLRDDAGTVAGLYCAAVETIEQVLAREQQAAECERLANLFEQAPGFMAMLRGPDHVFELTNAAYRGLVGHRDVIGRTVAEALPEVVEQGFISLLDRVRTTGEPFVGRGLPIRLQTEPEGPHEDRLLDFIYQPITDGNDHISGIFVEGTDVTERARANAELSASEARLRELNANLERQVAERALARSHTWLLSPELMGVLSQEGVFEQSNPAWQAVLGWSEAEVAQTLFFDFIHPDDLARTRAAWAATIERGEPALHFENRYRTKDGRWRWLSWIAVPDDDKIYCSARDVTAEREQAEALEQAEEALRQSQKMEAVGQLTGGIAHDFNNLLAGIQGSLEMIAARAAQGRHADIDRYVAGAQDAARRAAALTQRLLAFSRRQTLAPETVDVNVLVTGMEDLVASTVGPEVAIEIVAAAGLWAVEIDPSQLENALLNLCINARDAMPEGGRITIKTANRTLDARAARERDLDPGDYVSLCISDTGTGMTPEVIARAFEPFYTTKPIGVGTGLGLSMIYGFVRQSGGQVRIHSEADQGTTICLYLPRHHAAEGAEQAPHDEAPPPAAARDGQAILVIDDEAVVRMLVVDVLADLGYAVLEAADGEGGLKILRSDARIDLLVTDVGLPGGLNGRQVADAARTLRPGLRILFVTGYAENAVLSHEHLEPGMAVLGKPFDVDDLGRRVQAILSEP